jgi:N-acetylglucosaminyldiphosphoundecaprenol N-acetyl-beta-D-mannosaminyltransferase
MKRIRLGQIHADALTKGQALDRVADLIETSKGGYIVTPNIDHVVQAETSDSLRVAYADASLSLADGQPLIWLSRLMKVPLPQKISGSDFVPLLVEEAEKRSWRVFLLGAAPGVAQRASQVLSDRHPRLQIAGVHSPPFGFVSDPAECDRTLSLVKGSRPNILLVALGCPQQEVLMHRWRSSLGPTVAIGCGATLDFIAGAAKRAPKWISDIGLEWLYRLAREPRRLWRRYLVRDIAILPIAWRMLRIPVAERAYTDHE